MAGVGQVSICGWIGQVVIQITRILTNSLNWTQVALYAPPAFEGIQRQWPGTPPAASARKVRDCIPGLAVTGTHRTTLSRLRDRYWKSLTLPKSGRLAIQKGLVHVRTTDSQSIAIQFSWWTHTTQLFCICQEKPSLMKSLVLCVFFWKSWNKTQIS